MDKALSFTDLAYSLTQTNGVQKDTPHLLGILTKHLNFTGWLGIHFNIRYTSLSCKGTSLILDSLEQFSWKLKGDLCGLLLSRVIEIKLLGDLPVLKLKHS